MKNLLFLLAGLVLIGCGSPIEKVNEVKEIQKQNPVQIRNQVIESETYTAKILYAPIRHPHPELIKRLEAVVEAEKKIFFESEGLKEVEKDPSLGKWDLHISTRPIYESETFSSFLTQIYIYSGGAHGNTHYAVLNFDHQYGDTVEFTEVFDTREALNVVSEKSISSLTKKLEDAEWIADGAGPELGNFHYWNYTPAGMLLTFPPYQVAPYAAGSPSIIVEKKYLQPHLSKLGKRMWGE